MIGRPKGVTLAEIMKATDWQARSVRGFISTAAKKHGIKIESSKNEAGDRLYKIAKQSFPPGLSSTPSPGSTIRRRLCFSSLRVLDSANSLSDRIQQPSIFGIRAHLPGATR